MNKKVLLFIPLIIFFLLVYFLYDNLGKDSEYIDSALIGQPLPSFESTELGTGRKISSADFKGPALINIWATWCPTCYAEHGALMELAKRGVRIYGVDYRDDSNEAMKFLKKLGNPYQIVIADESSDVGFELGVYGAPETFFIDSQGVIQYRHIGEISLQNWQQELSKIYEAL